MTRALSGRSCLWLLAPLLLFAGLASAEPFANETERFSMDVPAVFSAVPTEAALHRFTGDDGARASVTRIDFSNLRAYWRHERQDFFAEIERGAARASTGYRLKSKKDRREDRTPIIDLHFEREHDGVRELVWMRFLLRRRFAIVATAAVPAKARRKTRKAAQALATSLLPYSPPAE